MSDHEFLQRYLRDRSQEAFTALVERHLPLVYSAARRQVRSTHLAEEIAQQVFFDLSRQAAHLPADQSLVAWLHVVTRRTAIDAVRREARRQAREQAAVSLGETITMTPTPDPWTEVEPLLDEAVETLGEPDRTAILLRFFQNKSLREVGAALGTSDDAAQKRVTRALEQLHRFFLRRGIAVTAAGLAADLSARTLQAVPAGLSSTIATTTSLSVAGTTAAALEGGRILVMSTLQKSLVAAAFVVAGGVGLYQANLVASQSTELASLSAQNDRLAVDLRNQRTEGAALTTKLQSIEQRIDAGLKRAPALSAADTALTAQMEQWLGQVDKLKDFLKRHPEYNLPEIRLLSAQDWFSIAATKNKLETDDDLRQNTAFLRHRAENMFASKLANALRDYVKAHDDTLPASPRDLAPLIDPPVEPQLLDRYEMLQQGKVSAVPRNERTRMMAAKSPADPENDPYWTIGTTGFGNSSAPYEAIRRAQLAYGKANNGEKAGTAAELLPYLPWRMSESQLEKHLRP